MLHTNTLKFLNDLKKSNNRDWFEKNKDRYLSAKENMSLLIDELLKDLIRIDKKLSGLTSKDCLFRIYRDVRFSKDKKPYKTNMGASINAGGKKVMNAGYYLHIEPGGSFLAGGIWMPPGDALKKIRQEIDYNGKKINKILNQKDFKKLFGELDGTNKLKTTPKGYDKNHPNIELLRYNSYIVWHKFSDKDVLKKDFSKVIAQECKLMKPFIAFLNTAMD